MLEVLFPDMFLDIEDLNMEDVAMPAEANETANAVAGPSGA